MIISRQFKILRQGIAAFSCDVSPAGRRTCDDNAQAVRQCWAGALARDNHDRSTPGRHTDMLRGGDFQRVRNQMQHCVAEQPTDGKRQQRPQQRRIDMRLTYVWCRERIGWSHARRTQSAEEARYQRRGGSSTM